MGAACCALLLLGLLGSVQAAEITVEVRDMDGEPLPEAVVWIEPGPTQPSPQPIAMDQQKRSFVPYILPVQAGTTVVFPNSDPINHHVYSFSPTKRFELRLHHQGDSAQEVRFDQAGLVTLGCNIHDWMLGFILVVDSPWFAQTDKQGHARLSFEPAANQQLHLWHPRIADPVASLAQPVNGAGAHTFQLQQKLKRDPRPKPPKNRPSGKGGYIR